MTRSRLPSGQGLSTEMIKFLESLDKRLPAQSDLGSSPTNEEIATAFNTLLSSLRNIKRMEQG